MFSIRQHFFVNGNDISLLQVNLFYHDVDNQLFGKMADRLFNATP